jgi:hypothetical protein
MIWTTGSDGVWSGRHWYGREQVEDKSPENVRACYRFLLSLPYMTADDRDRLERLAFIQIAKARRGK